MNMIICSVHGSITMFAAIYLPLYRLYLVWDQAAVFVVGQTDVQELQCVAGNNPNKNPN